MEEGQKLSKRQMELESAVKKLRQQVKASDADKEKLNALVAAERAECEGLRKAKAKAERDLAAAIESGIQEVEAIKQQGEEQLLKAQVDKVQEKACHQSMFVAVAAFTYIHALSIWCLLQHQEQHTNCSLVCTGSAQCYSPA